MHWGTKRKGTWRKRRQGPVQARFDRVIHTDKKSDNPEKVGGRRNGLIDRGPIFVLKLEFGLSDTTGEQKRQRRKARMVITGIVTSKLLTIRVPYHNRTRRSQTVWPMSVSTSLTPGMNRAVIVRSSDQRHMRAMQPSPAAVWDVFLLGGDKGRT